MGNTEIIGIGAVAVALFGAFSSVVWKLSEAHRKDFTELTNRVINVVEKNAEAMSKLTTSVDENTKVTGATKDTFNSILGEMLRLQGRKK